MCGIAGFVGPPDSALLGRMLERLHHRGPDDRAVHVEPHASLGATRLAIVDLAGGRQPLSNETGDVWVAFNGEIYDHAQHRRELTARGHRFATACDTEVIVHAYEQYGDDFVRRLNGQFAIAIWDAPRRRLLLLRDRLGIRPLYHARAGLRFCFASEIKALRECPGVDTRIDPLTLGHYFSFKNSVAPRTFHHGIRQLPPGCAFELSPGGTAHTWAYWQPPADIDEAEAPDEDTVVEHLCDLLERAVRRRLAADVDVGGFLSGGLDSSLVMAIAAGQRGSGMHSFTLCHDGPAVPAGKHADRRFARQLAATLDTRHHEATLNPDLLWAELPRILHAFDEPFGGAVSTYFLSRLVARHVKVALSGDGADELFGSYRAARIAAGLEPPPAADGVFACDPALPAARSGSPTGRGRAAGFRTRTSPTGNSHSTVGPGGVPEACTALLTAPPPTDLPWTWRTRLDPFTDEEKSALFTPDAWSAVSADSARAAYQNAYRACGARQPLNRTLEVDLANLLPNQVLPFVDRLSMAHSLEVRVPFLDHEFVEAVMRLPASFKIHAGTTKYVLRRMAERYLPRDIIDRPKEGFVQPSLQWLRHSLPQCVRDALSPQRLARQALFRPDYVQALIDDHVSRRRDHSAKLWLLYVYERWDENLEHAL